MRNSLLILLTLLSLQIAGYSQLYSLKFTYTKNNGLNVIKYSVSNNTDKAIYVLESYYSNCRGDTLHLISSIENNFINYYKFIPPKVKKINPGRTCKLEHEYWGEIKCAPSVLSLQYFLTIPNNYPYFTENEFKQFVYKKALELSAPGSLSNMPVQNWIDLQ